MATLKRAIIVVRQKVLKSFNGLRVLQVRVNLGEENLKKEKK
jgi:hypothetical protein